MSRSERKSAERPFSFDSKIANKLFENEKHRFSAVPEDQTDKIPENLWELGHRFKLPFVSESVEFLLPRGCNTVRRSGGMKGYLHGGASPEEAIVPTAKYKSVKAAWKKPAALQESAFVDRIHGLIEGWFMPRVSRNTPSKSLGFKGDFFSELLHELRVDLRYADYVSQSLKLPQCEDMRDTKAVSRVAEGFLRDGNRLENPFGARPGHFPKAGRQVHAGVSGSTKKKMQGVDDRVYENMIDSPDCSPQIVPYCFGKSCGQCFAARRCWISPIARGAIRGSK